MNEAFWRALTLSLGLQGPVQTSSPLEAGGPSLGVMTGLTAGTGLFDLATTLRGINSGARETNPLARPFMEAGAVPAVAYLAGSTALQALLANELKKQGKGWWWVPQAATSGLHLLAGFLNRRNNR